MGFIEKGKSPAPRFGGKLANPIALPPELHKPRTDSSLAQFSQKDFFIGNATIYNHLIIFTSRSAYDKFAPVTANYSLRSSTKDFGRTFFTVTPPSEKPPAAYSLCYLRWL